MEERMTSVDLMLEEHRVIERMLLVLEESAARLDRGLLVPRIVLAGVLDFFRVYADAGHHAKEEDLFFPALTARGVDPDASPIGALRAQHEVGRALVREMHDVLDGAAAGETAARRAFAASARDYIGMLREHIRLEDHYFLEYARDYLSPQDDEELRRQMDAVDAARTDGERYSRAIAEYEEALTKC
jgi:hemerythrin-like domain-containing protein